MSQEELKPLACPFCADELITRNVHGYHRHPLGACLLSGYEFDDIAAWNRRAQDVVPVLPSDWAPDRIYLQREQGEGGSHTWCEDSVGDGDLIEEAEYVRVGAQDVARAPLTEDQRVAIQECIDYLTPAAKELSDLGINGMGDSKHARCIRTLRSLLAASKSEA